MENQIRVALIGFGGMGQIYAKLIHAGMVPELKLVGVCCRNEAGQRMLAKEFPAVAVYANQQAMEAAADDYDAVIIVTPHSVHVEQGLAFAALGKHILMDKPAGIDAASVRKLVEFCKENRVSYGMIFQNRRLPVFQKAKQLLDDGVLGQLHRAVWVCNNWYRSPAYHRSAAWRSSWISEGGGLMINQNPHYVDLWNWLFGMPDRVWADMEFGRYNDFLVDDAVDIQMRYDNGFHGTMVSATGEAPGVNRLEIWGTKGRLTILENARLLLDENQVSIQEFAATNEEKFAGIPHAEREIPVDAPGILYVDVLRNFGRHLMDGQPLIASGEDGLREVQLANAVYVSGWEQKRVAVPVEESRYAEGLKRRREMESNR